MPSIINNLIIVWLASYSALSYAAATFAQDVFGYDWASLLFAGLAGLLGGVGRTILGLLSDKQFVGSIWWVLARDLIVALMGGGFAYLCVEGYNDMFASAMHLPRIDRGFRVLVIVVAGASGGRWLGTFDRFASDLIANARKRLRNGAEEPPPSIVAPLEGK